MNQARGNFQDVQNLSEEEREKRFAEMRKKGEEANKAVEEKLNKVLKPEQLTRFKQLSLQTQGTREHMRPEVAKDLGLSEEQQANFARSKSRLVLNLGPVASKT